MTNEPLEVTLVLDEPQVKRIVDAYCAERGIKVDKITFLYDAGGTSQREPGQGVTCKVTAKINPTQGFLPHSNIPGARNA